MSLHPPHPKFKEKYLDTGLLTLDKEKVEKSGAVTYTFTQADEIRALRLRLYSPSFSTQLRNFTGATLVDFVAHNKGHSGYMGYYTIKAHKVILLLDGQRIEVKGS